MERFVDRLEYLRFLLSPNAMFTDTAEQASAGTRHAHAVHHNRGVPPERAGRRLWCIVVQRRKHRALRSASYHADTTRGADPCRDRAHAPGDMPATDAGVVGILVG